MARLSVQKTVHALASSRNVRWTFLSEWTAFCETQVSDRIEIYGLYRADKSMIRPITRFTSSGVRRFLAAGRMNF